MVTVTLMNMMVSVTSYRDKLFYVVNADGTKSLSFGKTLLWVVAFEILFHMFFGLAMLLLAVLLFIDFYKPSEVKDTATPVNVVKQVVPETVPA